MLLRVINDNILISHPSYPGVYQDEAKNQELYKEIIIYFWVVTKTKKNWQNGDACFSVGVGVFNTIPLCYWKGDGCIGLI